MAQTQAADTGQIELAPIFETVRNVMAENRLAYNQADTANFNHGDHMVEVFSLAVRAAQEKQGASLSEAMDFAGSLLRELPDNGSAQVYARGLAQLGEQFRKYEITLENLIPYIRKVLREDSEPQVSESPPRAGDILKALLSALAGWQQSESGLEKTANPLDLGYMFDLGVAYMQAKARNDNRAAAIADAAATVSPLRQSPLRYESGKLAILTLLRALAAPGS